MKSKLFTALKLAAIFTGSFLLLLMQNRKERKILFINSVETPRSSFAFSMNVKELGSWRVDPMSAGTLGGSNLIGNTNGDAGEEPAIFELPIYENGEYIVFIRSRDFNINQGSRYFNIAINGVNIPHQFGKHGINGWAWEKVGPFKLRKGILEIKVYDTSGNYARIDSIFVTRYPFTGKPPESKEEALAIANVENPYYESLKAPVWAKTGNQPVETIILENDSLKIEFFKVPSGRGTVIQKRTMVRGADGYKLVTDRDEIMASLLIYATEGSIKQTAGQYPVFDAVFPVNGRSVRKSTVDIFESGVPYWVVPESMRQVAEHSVEIKGSCDVADIIWLWDLPEEGNEPVITAKIIPKKKGVFSLCLMPGSEMPDDSVDFVLTPFRYIGKRLPAESNVITNQYYSSPMSMMTTTNKENAKITTGIVLERESISLTWGRPEDISHGFGILGPEKGVLPYLAAPLPGTEGSKMGPGDEFSIKYRIIERPGDWYPAFCHVQENIFGLADYRRNYYGTMNETIFNTLEYALNDNYNGWDAEMKGFYNVEGRTVVSYSDADAFLSSYLLSGDNILLEKITIPTLAALITRKGAHFTNVIQKPGSMPALSLNRIMPVGSEINIFNNAAYGGIYNMTKGMTGIFSDIGIKKEQPVGDISFSNPVFVESAWLYKFTGDEKYAEKAKKDADIYIREYIDSPQTKAPSDDVFIAIDYYPHFYALIDMYEIFGDKKYLDAAEKAARWLLPTVWSYQNAPEDYTITIKADDIRNEHISRGGVYRFKGDEKFRNGYPEKLDLLEDEEVPFWLVSRTGLSIEQVSTYRDHRGANIIMANWAPDLMRLAKYTGDRMFEIYARNAIIGRYTNYPGYYYSGYWTGQMKPDYAYEGPDLTLFYYHHIPPFLGMLQDFLVTQAWVWSDGKISFPSYRSYGYAYFTNRYYGGSGGRFFDDDDMWIWLEKGLIEIDNVQIDWIGAKKDGVAGFALMNEDNVKHHVNVRLGDEVSPEYSGEVSVLHTDGSRFTVYAQDGEFALDVPPRALVAFVVRDIRIKGHPWAAVDYTSVPTGQSVTADDMNDAGNGAILQVNPEFYHAYVYLTDMPDNVKKAELFYDIGNGIHKKEDTVYPYEFIEKVEDPGAKFMYYLEITYTNGTKVRTQTRTLIPKTATV